MDVRTRSFGYPIAADCRLRHAHRRFGKTILGFVVQYPNGSSEKTALPVHDYAQALNYAEADLKDQWQVYRDRFLEELKDEE